MAKKSPIPTATNKVHFACFACRKSFKQQGSSNWNADVPQREFPCPECKLPMVRLGRYFKAPTQRALKQWLKVELLHSYGEKFESGNSGLARHCHTLSETVSYLAGLHPESEVTARLAAIRRNRTRQRQCG